MNGIIDTIAGNGSSGYSGDGGLATQCQLNTPSGIFIENNTLFISDFLNDRIRKMVVNLNMQSTTGTTMELMTNSLTTGQITSGEAVTSTGTVTSSQQSIQSNPAINLNILGVICAALVGVLLIGGIIVVIVIIKRRRNNTSGKDIELSKYKFLPEVEKSKSEK